GPLGIALLAAATTGRLYALEVDDLGAPSHAWLAAWSVGQQALVWGPVDLGPVDARSLAVSAAGRVYLADFGGDRVLVLSADDGSTAGPPLAAAGPRDLALSP